MKMDEFKALPMEDALTILNNHLLSLKDVGGRLEDNFKSGDFDFSYSLLKKKAGELGIVVDGKEYIAYQSGEAVPKRTTPVVAPVVKSKQSLVKEASPALTREEIAFVKALFASQQELVTPSQDVVKGRPMLVVPSMTGAKKTTGISVYVDIWERWSKFKSANRMYSGTDLMAMALEEFMEKYDEDGQ